MEVDFEYKSFTYPDASSFENKTSSNYRREACDKRRKSPSAENEVDESTVGHTFGQDHLVRCMDRDREYEERAGNVTELYKPALCKACPVRPNDLSLCCPVEGY